MVMVMVGTSQSIHLLERSGVVCWITSLVNQHR